MNEKTKQHIWAIVATSILYISGYGILSLVAPDIKSATFPYVIGAIIGATMCGLYLYIRT